MKHFKVGLQHPNGAEEIIEIEAYDGHDAHKRAEALHPSSDALWAREFEFSDADATLGARLEQSLKVERLFKNNPRLRETFRRPSGAKNSPRR